MQRHLPSFGRLKRGQMRTASSGLEQCGTREFKEKRITDLSSSPGRSNL